MKSFNRSDQERILETYKNDILVLKEIILCAYEAFTVGRPDEAKEILRDALSNMGHTFDQMSGCIVPELDD